MKKLFAFVFVILMVLIPVCAVSLLPYFDFDFDMYIDTYHQLIVNDIYYPEDGDPYFGTLKTVLSLCTDNLDEEMLIEEIKKQDIENLKKYIAPIYEGGVIKTQKEIESFLFNKENMYSAFISPTTDSAMSFFGHNFLIFYIPEAPMLSPCINFYAYYDHLSALGTIFAGLSGNLVSYFEFQPFFTRFLDYTATRDRSIILYKLDIDAPDETVSYVMSGLTTNEYPNYNFLKYNCSHGFMHIVEDMDPSITFKKNRALSPAMGIKMFNDKDLLSKAQFEFPAWNDIVSSKSPKQCKHFYKSLKKGQTQFQSEEPFKNLPLTTDVKKNMAKVSPNFSSLAFNYSLNQNNEHRFELWFQPLFNSLFEQNYVEHELMNLHAINGGVSAKLDKNNSFTFEGFEIELFSFDSIFPFTTLNKRPSFGADLSLGMRDYKFLAETEFYLGMALGKNDIFWFFGLDNVASTAPLEYTLNFRNILAGRIGAFGLKNTTDIVLYSTLHDYFHLENTLEMKIWFCDYLSFKGAYKLETSGGINTKPIHSGEMGLIFNFNIF